MTVTMDVLEFDSDGTALTIDLFRPSDGTSSRPGLLYLHGGAWRVGDRSQFHPQCERLAAAGFVAATAQYRLDAPIRGCVDDARVAFDRLVDAAAEIGLDRHRLAVGGGSAGGHLAACLAWCPAAAPRIAPAAVVLLNPVVDLVAVAEGLGDLMPDVGAPLESLSPRHQDLANGPPAVIFHGTDDSLVSIEHSRVFRDAALAAGADLRLEEYPGREHAFFNPVPEGFEELINAGDFDSTTEATRSFLEDALEPAR